MVELDVADLAFGGRALARAGGYIVFIDGALPGDRVEARVYRRKPHYAEARTERIVTPSPDRVPAVCSHTDICGGCRMQDLAYEVQLAHKERQVAECLQHLGGIAATIRPIVRAERTFGYRNKMEYSFGRDAEGRLTLGLHRRGFFDRPFDLELCHIAGSRSSEVVACVRDLARAEGMTPYNTRRHEGLLRFLVVREGRRTDQMMVNIVASEAHPAFDRWADVIRERFPSVRSILLNTTRRRSQVAIGDEERVLWGADRIEETLYGLTFEISSSSFFQTNSEQAERLLDAALEGLGLPGYDGAAAGAPADIRVLDLYSGTGTFTLPIARRVREVIGIESNEAAVRDAERNAARNGIANATFWAGEAMELLRDRFGLGRPDAALPGGRPEIAAVLVDPPRAGLHPGVVTSLIHLGAPRLVYVSCNPATLGRDLAALCEECYRVEWVRPVDMFPHTPHIECVASLVRR
ncbi:MAG TPA: 23S rRNA (uracil(1939)-C(5))-methyltransferase RlmD [Acidobacteriota bacterium]|nr:23S rRNA (uracil(1939)-C(5))-methyltransferase RlmD [Acidobacteriota bacterium]